MGSEMCIRDSPLHTPRRRPCWVGAVAPKWHFTPHRTVSRTERRKVFFGRGYSGPQALGRTRQEQHGQAKGQTARWWPWADSREKAYAELAQRFVVQTLRRMIIGFLRSRSGRAEVLHIVQSFGGDDVAYHAVARPRGHCVLAIASMPSAPKEYLRVRFWSSHPCLLYKSPSPRDS